MVDLLGEVGSGRRGRRPPRSSPSGDVHHAYLAEVAFPAKDGVRSAVYQAVCSPFRNALRPRSARGAQRLAARDGARGAPPRALRRGAGPEISWRFAQPPTFDNQFATLDLDGRRAALRIERTVRDAADNRAITTSLERRLA